MKWKWDSCLSDFCPIAPNVTAPERDSCKQVLLKERLRKAIERINPRLPQIPKSEALQNDCISPDLATLAPKPRKFWMPEDLLDKNLYA